MTREDLEAELIRAASALLAEMNAAGVKLTVPGLAISVERSHTPGTPSA